MTLTRDSAGHLSDTPVGATKKNEERADSRVQWVQSTGNPETHENGLARNGAQVDGDTLNPAIIATVGTVHARRRHATQIC